MTSVTDKCSIYQGGMLPLSERSSRKICNVIWNWENFIFPKQAYLPQSYELFLFTPEYLPHPMIKSFDISFRSTYFYSNANKKQKTTEMINVWFPATLLQHEPTQSTEVATTEPTTSSQRNLSNPSHLSCSLGTCVLQGSPPCTSLRFVSQPCVHTGRTL